MNNIEPDITKLIRKLLAVNNIDFQKINHEPAITCEQSAKTRGCDQKIGGKSILFKDKQDYRLFVMSAALQVDSKKVRKILKSGWLRFATEEELWEMAGIEKGALPPFGRGIIPVDLYLDESVLDNEEIAFNRKNDIQSIDYLTERRERYLQFSQRYGFYRIDGDNSPEKILEQALNYLTKPATSMADG